MTDAALAIKSIEIIHSLPDDQRIILLEYTEYFERMCQKEVRERLQWLKNYKALGCRVEDLDREIQSLERQIEQLNAK